MSNFIAAKTDTELRDIFACYCAAQEEHYYALALDNRKYVEFAHERADNKMEEDPDYCPVYEHLFYEMLSEIAIEDDVLCDRAHKHGLLAVCKQFNCEIYEAEEIVERF